MRLDRKILLTSVGLGITVILAISTVMGGLFVRGFRIAAVVLLLAVVFIVVRIWLHRGPASELPGQLHLSGFAYPSADWLSDADEVLLTELTKGAFLLLAFDRTLTGCWGKTYLYRRLLSGHGLPEAKGSLTGTPMALVGMASTAVQAESVIRDWARPALLRTLANCLTSDGRYRRSFETGTVGGKVPVFEPLRHDAGACLSTLFLGNPGMRDIRTLENLSTATAGPMAWDKAIVARTLLQAYHMKPLHWRLKRRMKNRQAKLLRELIADGATATKAARVWTNSYEYGMDANNQWATVWAILPSVVSSELPTSLRRELELTLRMLLVAQDMSATGGDRLLAGAINIDGEGIGQHVFATAIAELAWRTLEVYGLDDTMPQKQEARYYSERTLKRLLGVGRRILELPSLHNESQPLELEGYFAWAGLCLAGASLGIHISSVDAHKFFDLVRQLEAVDVASENELEKKYAVLIDAKGLLDSETSAIVARALSRISSLYQTVLPAEFPANTEKNAEARA
jgi:hypothetical protein